MKIVLAFFLVVGMLFSSVASAEVNRIGEPFVGGVFENVDVAGVFVANELLVTFAVGVSSADKGAAAELVGAHNREILGGETELWGFDSNVTSAHFTTLTNLGIFADISTNKTVGISFSAATTQISDPLLGGPDSWGLQGKSRAAYGSGAEEAWGYGYRGSDEVVVAVIDSGMDVSHPDLEANVWRNPSETLNSLDDDGNGYVDDIHGWSFTKNSGDISHAEGDGHGTHVAGTIGAVGGNGIGLSGIAPNVKMVGVQIGFPDPNNPLSTEWKATEASIVKAFDYVTDLKKAGVPVAAINASFTTGGSGYFSIGQAINRAGDQNILVVAATGNDGYNNFVEFPANYTCTNRLRQTNCVVPVTAHYTFGAVASWANRNSVTRLSAPGAGILSTEPGGKYGVRSGTSMAAPHAVGAVALCAALQPTISLAEKRELLLTSASVVPTRNEETPQRKTLDVEELTSRCGPYRVASKPLPVALENKSYSAPFTLHGGGKAAGTFSVRSSETLPNGMTMSPQGQLSGIPTRYGKYPVEISAEDDTGFLATSKETVLMVQVYEDVPSDSFYEPATHWLKKEGITTGVSDTKYGSQGSVTRAQMAAFLWRAAGSPTALNKVFVDEEQIPIFARKATDWLWAQGLTSNNPYNPNGNVTRAQMAAFLWRAAGSPPAPSFCGFSDTASIPEFAKQGTCWLKANNITTNSAYGPNDDTTRAQMAAFLWRAAGSPT